MKFKPVFCLNCKKEIPYSGHIPFPMHIRRKYCSDKCNSEYQKNMKGGKN